MDVREAMVVEAEALVAAVGLGGLTLRALASRVGVTQPALYRHFEGREALLDEVRQRGWMRMEEQGAERLACVGDPLEVLRVSGAFYVRFASANPGWFRLALALRDLPEDAPIPVPQASTVQTRVLAALSCLVPPDDRAFGPTYRAWWGLSHGLAQLVVERGFRFVHDDEARLTAAEDAVGAFVEGLAARWGPASDAPRGGPEAWWAGLRAGLG